MRIGRRRQAGFGLFTVGSTAGPSACHDAREHAETKAAGQPVELKLGTARREKRAVKIRDSRAVTKTAEIEPVPPESTAGNAEALNAATVTAPGVRKVWCC